MGKPTPVRRQYLEIKKQYPEAIVFFRLGDFYETFDEDAKIAARELDIVLTSRKVAKGQRVPMAGVPHHAAENYIAKLIEKGHKVAICEQVSDEPIKGLMQREVVRIVTPGTVVEPALLEEKRNNYLVAVVMEDDRAGLAYADITTGEFATMELDSDNVWPLVEQELKRLEPAEVLVPEGTSGHEKMKRGGEGQWGTASVTPYENWRFELENARSTLLEHFEVSSLDGFGCRGRPLAIRSAGGLLQYLRETQQSRLDQLDGLFTYSTDTFMNLDASTRRNLELTRTIRTGSTEGALLGVLDRTVTAMGGRLLRAWLNQPLLDIKRLQDRLDAVQAFYQGTVVRTKVLGLLKDLSDVERLTNRAVSGTAGPRDLIGLRESLELVPRVEATLADLEHAPRSWADFHLDPCEEVVTLIRQAIAEDPPVTLGNEGIIAQGFSEELDKIVAASQSAKEWINNLEARERKRTGIRSLKVGYNKVYGYYIEVTKTNVDAVPEDYVRKQTLVNAERYITPELKEYESKVLNAEEQITDLEARIFKQVRNQVASSARRMLESARVLARMDVYAGLAEVAVRNNYVRPELTEKDEIHISAGRHPVVELTQREEPFVPNDAHIDNGEVIVLTGPNMSGKSTWLRQVALIVLMAQMGSFIPADEAHIGLVDRIFTRIGAEDVIARGQSTFMVEMIETANILHHATDRSLLILDEIGRGTSTYDGISIAWAVVEHIHNHPRLRSKTLFATHYHELTELAERLPRVKNYNVAVAEEGDDVVFLRRIEPGGTDRSYGIHVAQLAGLPKSVIRRAEEVLEALEREAARAPGGLPKRTAEAAQQLALFHDSHPVLDELKKMDISQLTPLEAINKLYELQQRLNEEENRQ